MTNPKYDKEMFVIADNDSASVIAEQTTLASFVIAEQITLPSLSLRAIRFCVLAKSNAWQSMITICHCERCNATRGNLWFLH
ncbi:hypothetical protein [Helicobacter sp. T3_23-1056]